MSSPTLLCILLVAIIICCIKDDAAVDGAQQFIYHGFKDTNLHLGGAASITQDGILSLTNGGSSTSGGHGFHPKRLRMLSLENGEAGVTSFSTTFLFSVAPNFSGNSSDQMTFVISSITDFSGTFPGGFDFFAIVLGADLDKPVCISTASTPDYWNCPLRLNYEALLLSSGKPVQLWADYNGTSMELNVTLALILKQEPALPPLLSFAVKIFDLPLLVRNSLGVAYAGFSASAAGDNNGGATTHQVLGWSFSLGGPAQPLNYSSLLQQIHQAPNKTRKNLVKWLPATVSTLTILASGAAFLVLRRRRKHRAEDQEEGWEAELGPRRFSHKDLQKATNGFSSRKLLGQGAFGRVYEGALAASGGTRVAVKQISSESKHGQEQFMAEIVILGRLRHRNLVRLIGYCRHKDELLLVYEHMPNGSLDRYLHVDSRDTLAWSRRLHVIKDIASGLLYLHEDWEQVIVHRDVKASNVLLDAEMNGRLGDFGLARLHDHGADAHTTHVAGTRGYLAPELLRLGKATKATDVFAFGAFILEVACGRRPLGLNARREPLVLIDWVLQIWASGGIVYAMDPRLEDYAAGEAELVLKLGLLCSHPLPAARPSMHLVMQYLDGDLPLPEFSLDYLSITDVDQVLETTPSVATTITYLSGGR